MVVNLGLVALTLTIDMPATSRDDGSASDPAEVAPKVEVRGRQPDPSDGRSTRSTAAALGLTEPGSEPGPAPGAPDAGNEADQPVRPDEPADVREAPAIDEPAPVPDPAPDPGADPAPDPEADGPEDPDPAPDPGADPPADPEADPAADPEADEAVGAQPPPDPAPPPSPPPPSPPPPPPSAEARGAEALALLSYPWSVRLAGWTIVFEDDGGPLRGVTHSGERRIVIHVRPGDSTWQLARVIAHELGHAADLTYNDTGDRRAWKQARGIDAEAPWWPTSGAADFATGAGDFAECFASWQVGSTSLSRLAGTCSAADIELVASLS